MPAKTYLDVVEPQEGHDSIIAAAKPGYPILRGTEAGHLACGSCGDVLAWNVSAATVREMFIVVHRLILMCHCGAHNLVPGDPPQRRMPRVRKQRAGANPSSPPPPAPAEAAGP